MTDYTSNESALAGMKHLADAEAAKASQTLSEEIAND